MALTKVQTIGIETGISLTGVTSAVNLNVTGITTVGVVSATSLNVSGVITATNFVGSGSQLTGVASTENIRTNTNATFLQNINVTGIVTASGVNASGVITATSFSGSGANLTGLAATANVTTSSLVVIGVTTVAAGTTAAPSITPTGDSNTGIFFPSADTIAFGEGGAEALRIDSSGNLKLSTAATSILNSSGNKILNQTGSILQVVQDTKTDTFSTTNNITNAVEITGLSQAVTMSASSNKVLVMAQISVSASDSSEVGLCLYRGSTQIYLGDASSAVEVSVPAGMLWGSGAWQGNSACIMFLDTPGTGTHTYTVRIGGNGSSTIYVNRTGRDGASDPRGASSVTLLEVAT